MQRDLAPDVLRGFALLGILIVNIPFMAINSEYAAHGAWTQGLANGTAAAIIISLFTGKFYILFSFLFGYSASYIIKSERANRGRWIRRCLALIALGTIHFSLLWHGDILFLYGLFGLLLVPFLFRSERVIKAWSRSIYAVFSIILSLAAIALLFAERMLPQSDTSTASPGATLDQILVDGTFLEAIGPRVELWALGVGTGVLLQGGFVFVAFLVGLRAGRQRLLSRPTRELPLKRYITLGLLVGLPVQVGAGVLYVRNEQSSVPSEAIYVAVLVTVVITAPILTKLYVALLLKVLELRPRLVSWMRPAGKMSLTLYMLQSVITSLIFAPWGLGLFQRIDTWLVVVIACAIWLAQAALAAAWFTKFEQGPLEKMVHILTRKRAIAHA